MKPNVNGFPQENPNSRYLEAKMSETKGRYIRGGDGSHWVGCEETHWDCKIAKLEAEVTRLTAELAVAREAYSLLSKAAVGLIRYRARNASNPQLEKIDDYIRAIAAAISDMPGGEE